MNLEEMRALSDTDLAAEIQNQHEEWRNLRFQNALGRLTQYHQISEVRKAIASSRRFNVSARSRPIRWGTWRKQPRSGRDAAGNGRTKRLAKRRYARAQANRKTRRRR